MWIEDAMSFLVLAATPTHSIPHWWPFSWRRRFLCCNRIGLWLMCDSDNRCIFHRAVICMLRLKFWRSVIKFLENLRWLWTCPQNLYRFWQWIKLVFTTVNNVILILFVRPEVLGKRNHHEVDVRLIGNDLHLLCIGRDQYLQASPRRIFSLWPPIGSQHTWS